MVKENSKEMHNVQTAFYRQTRRVQQMAPLPNIWLELTMRSWFNSQGPTSQSKEGRRERSGICVYFLAGRPIVAT
jgi:protein-disulfide isomerase-like protein with CxxC motif